ncbi:MAG: hypothetical protein GWP06_03375 [Actinobacteria bacterium]|nr:hypothetical protein [Actinomycetota bacterium]
MLKKMSKRKSWVLWLAFAGAIITSCSQVAPTGSANVTDAAIITSIQLSEGNWTATSITSMVLEVYGSGVDTMHKALTLAGSSANAQIKVPVGKKLTFQVTAYQNTTPILKGSTIYTPKGGTLENIQIQLDYLVPTVILTPTAAAVKKNDTFTIYLAARHVTDLATIGAQVTFDNTKLKVVDLGREDTLLTKNSGSVMQLKFAKDNSAGHVDIVLGVFPSSAAVSGEGNICRIVFQALDAGSTDIQLSLDNMISSDLGLYDKSAALINSLALGSRIVIE